MADARRVLLAVCTLSTLLVSGVASAQAIASATPARPDQSARSGTAQVISTPPVMDGRLEDEVWRSGEAFSGFVQRELHEGESVSERTEVRILTDGEALYVGAWLYDREPGGIVAGEKVRDVTLTTAIISASSSTRTWIARTVSSSPPRPPESSTMARW